MKVNLFLILFLLITLIQFFTSSYEFFPFSSFGMYKNLVAEKNFREYSIANPSHREKDLLLDIGDRRFFIRHQLNQIPLTDPIQFKENVILKLRKFLSKEAFPSDSIFIIKYWHEFSARTYKTPDILFEIPIKEIRE